MRLLLSVFQKDSEYRKVMTSLGQGAFSTVNAVIRGGQMVALKTAHSDLWHFVCREINILRSLSHENIVKIESVEVSKNTMGFTMHLYPDTLRALILTRHPRLLDYFSQIAGAIAYCHSAGVIHGDIKSENILIGGNPIRAVLCDFGIARVLPINTEIICAPLYRPPEVTLGQSWCAKVDVWASGILLLEIIRALIGLDNSLDDIDCPLKVYSAIFGSPFTSDQVNNGKRMIEILGGIQQIQPIQPWANLLIQILVWNPSARLSSYEVYEMVLRLIPGVVEMAQQTFHGMFWRPLTVDRPIGSSPRTVLSMWQDECLWEPKGPSIPPIISLDRLRPHLTSTERSPLYGKPVFFT